MNEMLNYIFSSLRDSEKTIGVIQKTLRRQIRFDRKVTFFALAMTAYVVISEIDRREQSEKIAKLEKDVKRLKRDEGE